LIGTTTDSSSSDPAWPFNHPHRALSLFLSLTNVSSAIASVQTFYLLKLPLKRFVVFIVRSLPSSALTI